MRGLRLESGCYYTVSEDWTPHDSGELALELQDIYLEVAGGKLGVAFPARVPERL